MAGGDEARDASLPDDGAAAAMVGEMGGAFGGARRVRQRAVATFGRRQYRRRVSAVIIGMGLNRLSGQPIALAA